MRIAVVGAGAMGGFYGAKLARGGYDVHFLMRRDYQAVQRNGLTVHSWQGDFHLPKVNCYQDVRQMGEVDLVFIGLKTTANDHYEELVGPLMGPDTLALTVQNGLGNDDRLAELFGAPRVAGGLAFLCSNRGAPGVIEHLDYGHVHVGNYQRRPDKKIRQFAQMLNDSGVECLVVDDLALARWEKLVWNIPFNGLSTILNVTVDIIMADKELQERAWQLMKEVQSAAKACGSVIDDALLDKMIFYSRKMKPYMTSMQLDAQAGRPLEVDSIVAEPLRRGGAVGVPMPEMERLHRQLVELDPANLAKRNK